MYDSYGTVWYESSTVVSRPKEGTAGSYHRMVHGMGYDMPSNDISIFSTGPPTAEAGLNDNSLHWANII